MDEIVVNPTMIYQFFDKDLLSKPIADFKDSCKTIWKLYEKYYGLIKKCKNDPKRLEKVLRLQNEFLEIYERAKTKEKELEGKTEYKAKRSFYYIEIDDKNDKKIYRRFKYSL